MHAGSFVRWIQQDPYLRCGPTIVFANTAEVIDLEQVREANLTPAEKKRGTGFSDEAARRDFMAAHLLVRVCAAAVTGIPIAQLRIVQHCLTCGGPHGRPTLAQYPELHLSMSHAGGAVAAAVGPCPVGLDIERIAAGHNRSPVYSRVLAATERAIVERDPEPGRAFLRQWVRKEAMIKVGAGQLVRLTEINLAHLPSTPLTECLSSPSPVGGTQSDLLLQEWIDEAHSIIGAVVYRSGPSTRSVSEKHCAQQAAQIASPGPGRTKSWR